MRPAVNKHTKGEIVVGIEYALYHLEGAYNAIEEWRHHLDRDLNNHLAELSEGPGGHGTNLFRTIKTVREWLGAEPLSESRPASTPQLSLFDGNAQPLDEPCNFENVVPFARR
jgi:hypothetical protein